MIPNITMAQLVPELFQHDASGELGDRGFLHALQSALPAEVQGLSMQELVDWLREQGEIAVVDLPVPALPGTLEALSGLSHSQVVERASDSDTEHLLDFIMSSREQWAVQQEDEEALGLQQTKMAMERSSASVGEAPFQALLVEQQPRAVEAETGLGAEKPLPVPVRHPEFAQAVGERLVWLVRNEVQQAKIRLDPPSLGPLEISISVQDDQASVVIQAHHALTRELLEAEAPRLRSMLDESGFAQVDVDVARDEAEQEKEQSSASSGTKAAARDEGRQVGAIDAENVEPRITTGLIDQYV